MTTITIDGDATVQGSTGITVVSPSGDVYVEGLAPSNFTATSTGGLVVVHDIGTGNLENGGSAPAQFIAAPQDLISLNAGSDTVNALAGGDAITLGFYVSPYTIADATVFGAAGDRVGYLSAVGPFITDIIVDFEAGTNPIVLTSSGGSVVVNSGPDDTLSVLSGIQLIGAAGDNLTLGPPDPVNATLDAPDTVNALAGGETITLASGAEATIYGATGDTIGGASGTLVNVNAGANPLILASTNGQTLINDGIGDTLTAGAAAAQFIGAAGDNITLTTSADTVNALAGNETIIIANGNATVFGAAGDAIAGPSGTFVTFTAGSNPIVAVGSSGSALIYSGAGDTLSGGAGSAQFIGASGDNITLASGPDTVNATAGNEMIALGSGSSTIYGGAADTVGAGTGKGFVDFLSAANELFLDQTGVYADTVAHFSQPNGDRIHLTTDTVSDALAHSTQVNGVEDTLITLSDNSTILLKGVSSIDSAFFS